MKQFYTKTSLSLMMILICGAGMFAQNKSSFWTKTTKNNALTTEQIHRKSEPTKALFYELNIDDLKNVLQNAPLRSSGISQSNIIIEFPSPDGKLEAYRVMEASVMHPTLQAQYPEIRSYVGQSISDPSTIVRFSVTPQGLHALVLSHNKGTQFIDPYSKNGNYIVYSKRDLPVLEEGFLCEVVDQTNIKVNPDFDLNAARNANDGQLRTYELAIACTIEYSAFHVNAAGLNSGTLAQKKAAVLAAMNVTMTRVNGVYENELSLTMELVPNNTAIIYVDSDTFDNNNAGTLINQSQTVIDSVIGSANYDIGHTFSTGGGGLAQVNSPCNSSSKAKGITGSPAPVGDAYDIDYVAHEMGHQFGSNHTFNGSTGNCAGGNRSAANAYETGSGSTIMAYAGICSPQNVQSNSDAYFHQRSLVTIWANISSGTSSSCPTITSTGNFVPTAEAGNSYIIPISTPYKLTGSSTDADGVGTHTYTWEQYDLGPAGAPTETTLTGPLVRSFEGTSNPSRYVPRLQDLITNQGSTTWEKLASISRPISYRLTVRDNDVRGGQTAIDNMIATTVSTAGPFMVTSQNTDGITWVGGTTETITWNVAGTTANGVNAANVNILLSTDGGLTYDTVLASNTPNDGSHDIIVPANVQAANCRIMVEGAGNIFFNINSKTFAVGVTVSTTCTQYASSPNLPITDNGDAFTETDQIVIPNSSVITDINIGLNVTHSYIGDLIISVLSPSNTEVRLMNPNDCGSQDNLIVKFDASGADFNCDATGANQIYKSLQGSLSSLNGEDTAGNWLLGIGDYFASDVGTFNSWYVEVCETVITPLGVDDLSLEDFTIFPNPNNGEFTIKLKSYSNKDINVQVYDVRGRLVFNNAYINSSEFNQTINLKSVQSGMYLVKVSDGERQVTKKIVVE